MSTNQILICRAESNRQLLDNAYSLWYNIITGQL